MAANLTVFPALSSIVFCVFHQFRKGSAPDLTAFAPLPGVDRVGGPPSGCGIEPS
jgi:hypothetical protein